MKRNVLVALLAGFLSLVSCSKEDNKEEPRPVSVKEERNLNARAERWVYYSFDKGIVQITEPQNSLDWDIAFFAFYMKVNGGVIKTESKDFSAVTTAPAEGYQQDTQGKMSYGNYPNLVERDDSFSSVLSGGFDTSTGYVSLNPNNSTARGGKWPSVYAPTKWVYIIRTAKGAFAKFQVTDFYNERTQANYPTFQYQVSEDGKF